MQKIQGERDDGVRADLLQLFEFGDIAAGGDDLGRSEVLGQLHGDSAGGSGGAVDQDGFAGDEVSTLHQAGPRGHAGVGDGGGGDVVDGVGDSDAAPGVDGAELGQRPEGRLRHGEVDAAAILGEADAVGAGDRGEDAGGAVVAAGGARFCKVAERGGADGDDLFARFCDGGVEVCIDGGLARGGDDGCFHGESPLRGLDRL
jgi:hypothetical protein